MAGRLFIAGNWKMNMSMSRAVALARALVERIGATDAADLAVCPPYVCLSAVGEALAGSKIALGAQNMFYEDDGAFTGEISGAMLKDVGCRYVILGHSERRHVIGENDELINHKIIKALADGLEVIFCVGELPGERQAGRTLEVVSHQVKVGLEGASAADMARVTIAYEPVWAIGTGVTATPAQAQEVHGMIRDLLVKSYDSDLGQSIRIQYGGSVKPNNARALLALPDVNGALVGGASLKADDFAAIVQAAINQ